MESKRIIIPLPSRDFDPTETAVPWKTLREAGHSVEFATPDGKRGYADPLMLSGEGLDPWGWIPGLKRIKLAGLALRADRPARDAYGELERDDEFLNPKRYADLCAGDYDGLILPGGHAPGMKVYLEDRTLQGLVADFFETTDDTGGHKPVGAICHGVVAAARSISPGTGKSVLYGRKTTSLTWRLERSAWRLTKYYGRFWDPSYYRTYMESGDDIPGYLSVEMEVRRALKSDGDFRDVPLDVSHRFMKTSGLFRDSRNDSRPSWVVRDGNYIPARWPGDVYEFSDTFLRVIEHRA
jgi:putative intracellular protease/amidase